MEVGVTKMLALFRRTTPWAWCFYAAHGYDPKAGSQPFHFWVAFASLTIVAVQTVMDFYLKIGRSRQVETVLALVAQQKVPALPVALERLLESEADRLQYPPRSDKRGDDDP
jgi:hypothetical protein